MDAPPPPPPGEEIDPDPDDIPIDGIFAPEPDEDCIPDTPEFDGQPVPDPAFTPPAPDQFVQADSVEQAGTVSSAPLTEEAQNPKPGVYDEEQMKKMIEEAKKNGEFIFIQISATWCGPCAKSIKDMQAMMDKYKDVSTYIVVEMGVTKEQMEAYAKKYKDTILLGFRAKVL